MSDSFPVGTVVRFVDPDNNNVVTENEDFGFIITSALINSQGDMVYVINADEDCEFLHEDLTLFGEVTDDQLEAAASMVADMEGVVIFDPDEEETDPDDEDFLDEDDNDD